MFFRYFMVFLGQKPKVCSQFVDVCLVLVTVLVLNLFLFSSRKVP